MKIAKQVVCFLLALCLCAVIPLSAGAQEDATPYIQRMIQYYLHYQAAAETEIETLLGYIESVDPGQGTLWRGIMEDWRWSNEEMPVYRDVLPDGLPQDDSLCIVVLGYGLRADGSMKEELVDRLVVALASALKYPNAFICVTGGPTASGTNDTEGGQMSRWLMDKGVDPGRILVEERSLSTHENAQNVFALLRSNVPQVDSVAIVSSDYHIPWGVSMFTTMSNYTSYYHGDIIRVVGNAANSTENNTGTLYSQAIGISVLTNTPFDGSAVPAMYTQRETMETTTLPTAEPVVEVEEKGNTWMIFPAVMIGLAVVILLIPTKRKEKKKV
ncbi:MAG: YdcF family protein [Oscillospiraceae bacterium]|nr:YdcF family protein [Oscillospiraceae bacterium]